ncbi:MAG: biotin transporter BioY [Bacillota bacterium]
MKLKTRDIVLAALHIATVAVSAQLKVATEPIPVTLQVFAVFLGSLLLGGRRAAIAQFAYMLVGLFGVPVFANGGGPGYLLRPSFGYIIGFLPAAYISGSLGRKKPGFLYASLGTALGLLVLYAVGVPYSYFVLRFVVRADVQISQILAGALYVYLPVDVLKIMTAVAVAVPIMKRGERFFS